MSVIYVLLALQGLFLNGVSGTTSSSFEHRIREELLDDYDKNVRPVRPDAKGKRAVQVAFGMKISRLVKVDSKEQVVIVDTWVVQMWRNEFLSWNASEYGDVNRVHFTPDEVWVPDISLFNNGDDTVTLAGGRAKFVTEVSVNNEGQCVWSGPATFKANCDLKINDWPFDEQTCELGFGSYTYGTDRMNIKLFEDKSGDFTNRFISSGDWDIANVTTIVTETDHGDCCPFDFSEVVYTLSMKRKPLYHLFYLTMPCIILTILALSSFLIPVESGERIGFVTTILLAMIVFLLLIPSFLPETSDSVPILGISLQITLWIIVLILFANIFVLKVYFMDDTPPQWIETICNLCSKKKSPKVQRIHVSGSEVRSDEHPAKRPAITSRASMNAIELSETRATTARSWDSKGNDFSWQKASVKLDYMFFVFFLIVSLVSSLATYLG